MTDASPEPLADALARLARTHRYERENARDAADIALEKATADNEHALNTLYHQSMIDVAKGALDRSRDSAKYVQTAAAAIVGFYTAALGLVFSVTDHPLPTRGIYAAAFLGLAIALATAYLTFIKRAGIVPGPPLPISLITLQLERTNQFIRWMNLSVENRRWALRAATIALLCGVAFMPAAFIGSARVASAPPAPVAPTFPATVPTELRPDAVALFRSQVQDFQNATAARGKALAAIATAAADQRHTEDDLNVGIGLLAAIALLAVLLVPTAWAAYEKRESPPQTLPAGRSTSLP